MAALSAIRNRKSQKLREGFEDLLARCVERSEARNEVELDFVLGLFQNLDITIDEKEQKKLEKLADKNRKMARQDFTMFAKSSKAIKSVVEKENRLGSRPGSRGGSRPGTPVRSSKNIKIDKAAAAFKVRDVAEIYLYSYCSFDWGDICFIE